MCTTMNYPITGRPSQREGTIVDQGHPRGAPPRATRAILSAAPSDITSIPSRPSAKSNRTNFPVLLERRVVVANDLTNI